MDQARLRPAQVGASTAAAVGGAFLASGLGVYGTIIGVGVISLMSTVGSEMLLRSLERTKEAARTAAPRLRATAPALADATGPINAVSDNPTIAHTLPDLPVIDDPQPAKAPRWPLVVGGSLASFGLALAVIIGIESLSATSVAGNDGTTVINVIRGNDQGEDDAPLAPAPTGEPSPTPNDAGTSSNEPADDTAPHPEPTTSPDTPPEDGESTPPDGETPPPDDEETPPPDEGETPPPTAEPTPSPTP